MLHALSLLGSDQELADSASAMSVLTGPAPSVAVIEAGATALTKVWSVALAAGVTGTAIVAVVKGVWGDEHDIVRVAIVSGAAIVLAAFGLAIAIIVSTDVRARATAAATVIEVRARVAKTFLTLMRPGTSGAKSLLSEDLTADSPSITSMVASTFTGQSPQAPSVDLAVQAIGLDAAGRTWFLAVQPGQAPKWVPQAYVSSAKP